MTIVNKSIERRKFLRDALAVAGATATLPALTGLNALAARGRVVAPRGRGGYGPLFATPDERDGVDAHLAARRVPYHSFSPAGS